MVRVEPRHAGRRGRRGRSGPMIELRRTFLVVCEGQETEPNYVRAFPVATDVRVTVRGEGRSTLGLVDVALQVADEAAEDGRPYDEVWVVYDQDDFGAERFNAADLALAHHPERWRAAWSNSCFELWFLLHFQFVDSSLHRHELQAKLKERLGSYRKNDPRMYDRLLSLQDDAIRNADRLARRQGVDPYGQTPPAEADPCTLVYRLVQALNAEIR